MLNRKKITGSRNKVEKNDRYKVIALEMVNGKEVDVVKAENVSNATAKAWMRRLDAKGIPAVLIPLMS